MGNKRALLSLSRWKAQFRGQFYWNLNDFFYVYSLKDSQKLLGFFSNT